MAVQGIEHQMAFKGSKLPMQKADPKYVSSATVKFDPNLRPTMRQATRWDYAKEYFGYYIDHYRFLLYTAILLIGGIMFLGFLAPVGLLMIMLGAKYKSMSWWDRFIYRDFGKNRSVVLMN